ncbi:hypothetical protein HCA00_04715 [Listeria booriae]|uniref:hypothetical protein n=1 Tax=Listeria booriae TaxID=1552123 RepID=UPI00164E8B59|nr:hypothetical protein [Listeria booriae]MBC6128085.1 hypothetical protein [Listeria booriae]
MMLPDDLKSEIEVCSTISFYDQPNDMVQQDIKSLLSSGYQLIYFETRVDSEDVTAVLKLRFKVNAPVA